MLFTDLLITIILKHDYVSIDPQKEPFYNTAFPIECHKHKRSSIAKQQQKVVKTEK